MKFLKSLLLIAVLFSSCAGDYTPKPRAYFRIEFPEKNTKITSQTALIGLSIRYTQKFWPINAPMQNLAGSMLRIRNLMGGYI